MMMTTMMKMTMMNDKENDDVQVLLETPRGRTTTVMLPQSLWSGTHFFYDELLWHLLVAAKRRDEGILVADNTTTTKINSHDNSLTATVDLQQQQQQQQQTAAKNVMMLYNGRVVERDTKNTDLDYLNNVDNNRHKQGVFPMTPSLSLSNYFQLKLRIRGGMDRQNRVGSKFGGGGVSSGQQSERERKERLRKLALESIDLAKDPYLMRNHLGSYECKLCLTLHTNEANYLAHTQGKKHQQGLAKRAYMEQLKQEKEQQQAAGMPVSATETQQQQPKAKKIRIGRPAYQVFKSRDADSNQRCLSFELHYPEIEMDLQPRHRFMSAFEQRIESPPDRRFQYLLFAAEPYETVAFKIPNEPLDKGEDKFVTHWDAEDKKFTLSLSFVDEQQEQQQGEEEGQ
jgi:splicing factor 3A subunit 2